MAVVNLLSCYGNYVLHRQSIIRKSCGFRKAAHTEEFEYLQLTVRNFSCLHDFVVNDECWLIKHSIIIVFHKLTNTDGAFQTFIYAVYTCIFT